MKTRLFLLLAMIALPAAAGADVTYKSDIAPIFKAKCVACHGLIPQGKLKLNSLKNIMKGGANGAAVIPGNADGSLMVKQFYLPLDAKTHMPPKGSPQLTEQEIATIKAWINGGAK
ncbi:MAG: c-type cytochrome domain-containing protein [Verrucomicrobiota bacterium]